MTKIVVLGSCRYEPYEFLAVPNRLNPDLYKRDHTAAYEDACKVFYPAIDKADEVWVYAPDGIGEHTAKDLGYAEGKKIRLLIGLDELSARQLEDFFKGRRLGGKEVSS